MSFVPSEEQAAILQAVMQTNDNLAIKAGAGCGKTTILVEIAKLLPAAGAKLFCAFNKDIVSELETRLKGTGVRTQTFHSIGFGALKKHLGTHDMKVESGKYREIVQAWVNMAASNEAIDERDERAVRMKALSDDLQRIIQESAAAIQIEDDRVKFIRETFKETVNLSIGLLNMLRLKLVEWDDINGLLDLIQQYRMDDDINNDMDIVQVVMSVVPDLMTIAEEQTKKALTIDYTDMIYWAVRWNVRMYQYNFIMVDEAQDLSPVQRRLIEKALWERGGRIFIVGDPRQAIYAFAGADSDSFDQTVETFNARVFPMMLTRRCFGIVTEHAAQIVYDFTCPPDKPRGKIVWLIEERLSGAALPGDMVLCRLKAPIVAACLDLIAAGKPATILGSDIGKSLVALVEKIEGRKDYKGFPALGETLETYENEQVEKWTKKHDDMMVQQVQDNCAALRVLIESAKANDIDGLKAHIESLFSERGERGNKIVLSTIHKSKGLEADRVFILKPEKLPLYFLGMTAEASEQENNLDYVARTRAKSTLVYLTNPKYTKENIRPFYAQDTFDDLVWDEPVKLPAADTPNPDFKLPAGITQGEWDATKAALDTAAAADAAALSDKIIPFPALPVSTEPDAGDEPGAQDAAPLPDTGAKDALPLPGLGAQSVVLQTDELPPASDVLTKLKAQTEAMREEPKPAPIEEAQPEPQPAPTPLPPITPVVVAPEPTPAFRATGNLQKDLAAYNRLMASEKFKTLIGSLTTSELKTLASVIETVIEEREAVLS